MALIHAQDLKKTYRTGDVSTGALRGVSFSIDEGAFVSFIGPSGSGKTTLLNLMGCRTSLRAGSSWWRGMRSPRSTAPNPHSSGVNTSGLSSKVST
ncbi:MAG: ATP-binding cassette domain-containing protein [Desulfobacterales bacterium]